MYYGYLIVFECRFIASANNTRHEIDINEQIFSVTQSTFVL